MTDIQTLQAALRTNDISIIVPIIRAACQQQQEGVLPDLVALLDSPDVGYFVEECLGNFGDKAIPLLQSFLHETGRTAAGRERAAALLGLLGDVSGVPVLLGALEQPAVNQSYFTRLAAIAPHALIERLAQILERQLALALQTTDAQEADYFAKLIETLTSLRAQQHVLSILETLFATAQYWAIRVEAGEALYAYNPTSYAPRITSEALRAWEHGNQHLATLLNNVVKGSDPCS